MKRLTAKHWQLLRDTDPYDPRLRAPSYDKLDAEAIAAGYERDRAFRPWYQRHVMAMVALTRDGDAFDVITRLNEIADAQREVPGLTEALREWMAVTELIASVRGDA